MKTSSHVSLALRLALSSFCWYLAPFGAAHAASIVLDSAFHPPAFTTPAYGSRVLLLPDGKYVHHTLVNTLTDQPTGAITRYLPDGTLDTSFSFSRDYDDVFTAGVLPDGRLILEAEQDVYGAFDPGEHILRLNSDGSIDPTFNSAEAAVTGTANPLDTGGANVRTIAIQSDGKILLAGFIGAYAGIPHPGIVRLLADGTLDASFAAISLQFADGSIEHGLWAKPAIQPDGKILIAGDFTGVNGTPDPGVARLNSNGTLDATFNPAGFTRFSPNRHIRGVVIQADGKIIIGGEFNVTGGAQDVPLVRLNSDGSLDQSYVFPGGGLSFFGAIHDLVLQPDGKPIAAGNSIYRLNTDGSLDSTFTIPVLIDSSPSAFPGVFTLNLQPDGRILVGGTFSDVDDGSGTSNDDHWGVARFNTDGTLDVSLATPHKTANRAYPSSFTRQSRGSTLLAFVGSDTALNPPALPHSFGQLLLDGSLNPSFDPVASFDPTGAFGPDFRFDGFNLLADGELLDFGQRDLVIGSGTGTFTYGKLFPDGTEDKNYMLDPSANFSSTSPLSDGRVLVASSFPQSVVDNTELRRLNADGTLDSSFALDSSILANTVQRDGNGVITNVAIGSKILAVLSDGRILFSYLAFDGTFRLVRLNADGSFDSTFPSASIPATTSPGLVFITDNGVFETVPEISAVSLGFTDALPLTNGQVIATGDFASYAGKSVHGIVRLNPDGSVDSFFLSGGGAQWTQTTETSTARPSIDNIELENDGKFLITGTFEAYNSTAAPGLATLNADGSFFESLGRIASRARFDNYLSRALLARQPDGSFYLSGPYVTAGQTEHPSFIHITSLGGAPIVGQPLAATGVVGQLFTYQIAASGQPTGYGSLGLIAGLSLNLQTGMISGTPAFAGTFYIDISATNSEGTGHAILILTIQPLLAKPVIVSPTSANAMMGDFFSYQIVATNTPASYNATGLPDGLTVNTSTGLISGTATATGTSSVNLSATNNGGTGTAVLTLKVVANTPTPVITSPLTATATVGKPFTYVIVATKSPTSYDATNLPDGLSINSGLGVIIGTPTTAGTQQVGLSAIGSGGTGIATLSLTVQAAPVAGPSLISATSVTGRTGIPFSFQVITSGTSASARVSATGLAPGLSIDPVTGFISGTPSADGSFSVTLTVTDGSLTIAETLEMTFTSDPAFPVITSPSQATLTTGQPFSYTIVAPTSDPNDPVTFALIGTLPPGLSFNEATGSISGTFQARSSLLPSPRLSGGVVTNVQLFATNSRGTATIPLFFLLAPTGTENISTRLAVGTDFDVLIGGVIITGNAPKKVLIRAIGPSLNIGGVPVVGRLQDTTLELYDGHGVLLGSNDNWRDTQEQEIIDTTIPPADGRESAILATLAPNDPAIPASGIYTVIVKGANSATGVGLVEVYDLGTASLDGSSEAQLANISTRGKVQTGDNVMIGGFIVGGSDPSTILVRAIGPELTAQGVAGALEDTILELHDGTGALVASNDDWETDQKQEIIDTTIPPTDPRESAILSTLNPGAYTAIVRGKNGAVGVALVEAYLLK